MKEGDRDGDRDGEGKETMLCVEVEEGNRLLPGKKTLIRSSGMEKWENGRYFFILLDREDDDS